MMVFAQETSSRFVSHAVSLGYGDLLLATLLVVATGLVSIALRLGVEKRLALAAVRTVFQLLLVGYILRYIFETRTLWVLLLAVLVMVWVASSTAIKRPSRTYRSAQIHAFVTLVLSALLTTSLVTGLVIGVRPWAEPRYLIPLLGMALGNSLTGISLCLDTLLESLAASRHAVEMDLAMGATRIEAARLPMREAIRKGMIPIINTMMVVGIVSLPGMMTGQILAGADPAQAVRYQIVVMFMVAAATTFGCIFISVLACRRLFNEKHQLRSERIVQRS